MSKMEESTVRIENTETGEVVEYRATKTPYKNNVGHYLCGNELNHNGMAKLQAKGHNIRSDVDFRDAVIATYNAAGVGLTTEDFGRTPNWDTPEQRAKFKVTVNGKDFNPDFTEAQLKKQQLVAIEAQSHTTPIQTIESVPQAPIEAPSVEEPITVLADTVQVEAPEQKVVLNPQEIGFVTLMEQRISEGKWNSEQLIGTLAKKVGQEKAEQIFSLAQPQEEPTF